MEQICLDILNKWAEYVNYDENQTTFNLLNYSYDAHKTTKKFKHIIEDYDNTGLLAVLTAKRLFKAMLHNSRVNLLSLVENPSELYEHIEMYNLFESDEIKQAESRYIESIKNIILQIVGKKLIGQFDDNAFQEKIFDYTDEVIQGIDKCHIELYKKGGLIGKVTKFSTKIHVFPSLAECVLKISNADDGIYLCFIDVCHSADSYFGFFIKSNGTLFAVHERINEAYKGAHANSRNGRWTDGKVEFFPYDFIFSFEDYDYKGYSHTYNIDEDKLSFFDLTEDVYLPLTIAMVLLVRKFENSALDGFEEVYIDSLLEQNRELLNIDKNELMVVSGNDIVKHTNSLSLDFDYSKIMDGTAVQEFDGCEYGHNYVSTFNNGQIFVDLYGEGFEIKPTLLNTKTLLTDSDKEYIPEFVGSDKRLRAQAYVEIREQLANYLYDQMYKEYRNFGGMQAVNSWFKNSISDNLEALKKLFVEHFVFVKNGGKQVPKGWESTDINITYDITYLDNVKYLPYEYGKVYIINPKHSGQQDGYDDLDTGNLCSIFFIIQPKTYQALEELFGEIPKIVKGWNRHGHHTSGNSILSMTDKVETVGTPFEQYPSRREEYKNDRTYTNFTFALGFSKRGFKALCKDYGVDMKLFDKQGNDSNG